VIVASLFASMSISCRPCAPSLHGDTTAPPHAAAFGGDTKIVTLETPADVHEPEVAVDAKGRVFVVYASNALVSMSISTDSGASFGQPVAVGRIGKIAVGMRRGPRVVAAKDSVVVSAIGGPRGDGHDGDLVAWRSTTAGISWNAPVRVNDLLGAAREGLHAMAAGPKGEVACAWIDLRSGKAEIYAAVSTDEGASFSPNHLVYHSPDESVCECCHPSIAIDAQSTIHVMFRNHVDGARDMYLTESKDGGKTWNTARKLGTGTWKITACPMDGGSLAVDAAGKIASLWRREQTLYRADVSPDSTGASGATGNPIIEHEVKPGEQAWIASGDKGFFSTWLTRRGGDLWVLAPGADAPTKLAENANDPMIASSTAHPSIVIAVWEASIDGKSAIRAARLDP
jgi:hypothetical protein